MTPGESIEVHQIGNGWYIRPCGSRTALNSEIFVFKDLNFTGGTTDTLVNWIVNHFKDPKAY